MEEPIKTGIMLRFRKNLDGLTTSIPLPNINPDIISILSVIVTIVAVWNYQNFWWLFSFIILACLLDWLDGLIAKRYHRTSAKGYLVDMVCDRLSEGILFWFSFTPWFYFFLVNIILSIISWKTKKHFTLALRWLFLIFILLKHFNLI